MFRLESFVEACRATNAADPGHKPILDLARAAFASHEEVLAEVGTPERGGLFPIYQSDTLTIVNIVWPDGMTLAPHNHNTWAVIGIYYGLEDNRFWKRVEDDPDGKLIPMGTHMLKPGDVQPLGESVIHSVTNPGPGLTGALHIYGADFFEIDRSEWDSEGLIERPYDMSRVRGQFSG